jgi:hypothetical protein
MEVTIDSQFYQWMNRTVSEIRKATYLSLDAKVVNLVLENSVTRRGV